MSLALGWLLSLSLSFSFEVRWDAQAFPYLVCSFCPKLRKIKKINAIILNRTLHGRLEIQNFSSRVEKIFHSFAAKFRISAQPCNILLMSSMNNN